MVLFRGVSSKAVPLINTFVYHYVRMFDGDEVWNVQRTLSTLCQDSNFYYYYYYYYYYYSFVLSDNNDNSDNINDDNNTTNNSDNNNISNNNNKRWKYLNPCKQISPEKHST